MEIKQIENNMVIMFRATDVVKHAKKCGFDITEAEGAELLRRMLMDTPNQDQDLITALEEQVESAFVTFSLTSGVPKLLPREELESTILVLHL